MIVGRAVGIADTFAVGNKFVSRLRSVVVDEFARLRHIFQFSLIDVDVDVFVKFAGVESQSHLRGGTAQPRVQRGAVLVDGYKRSVARGILGVVGCGEIARHLAVRCHVAGVPCE